MRQRAEWPDMATPFILRISDSDQVLNKAALDLSVNAAPGEP